MSAPDSLAIAAMLDSLANAVDLEYGGADDRTREARRLASLLRGPNQAVPPTPPPIDADAGAFVEAVDAFEDECMCRAEAIITGTADEGAMLFKAELDAARARVLSLHAAAVARAEAAEAALDAIGRHTHIGAGDVVDDGPPPFVPSPFRAGHR